MAEKTDNEDGIDTNDFAGNLPRRLPLGSKDEFGAAIAHEKSIMEIAQILQSLADFGVEAEQLVLKAEAEERREIKRRVSVKDYFSKTTTCFKKLFETLGIVLDWLEESSGKAKDEGENNTDGETKEIVDGKQQNTAQYQKKEDVLRGLYHITELGKYTCFVGLLELFCKFLDMPENLYKAKREYVKKCLNEVEKQQQKVSELVEKVCDILQEIIREPQFNRGKAAEFNSTVRQANVITESCKEMLSHAEEIIDELMRIMSIIKGFSRLLRFAGFGATCYGLYHMSPSASTVDSLATYIPSTGINLLRKLAPNPGLKYVGFAATCAVAGYAWLSLFPSKAYAFLADLEELKLKHKRLKLALNGLEKMLKAAHEDVREQLSGQCREDSV